MSKRKRPTGPKSKDSGQDRKAGGSAKTEGWLYGTHAVLAALANEERRCKRLVLTEEARATLENKLSEIKVLQRLSPEIVPKPAIGELLPPGAVHQGIALLTDPLPDPGLDALLATIRGKTEAVIVLLDQVTDPQNVGAVLRSAAAFGVDAVLLPLHHAPAVTGALAKAASGTLERVPLIHVPNLARAMDALKAADFWCVGLDAEAETTLDALERSERTALLLGAEGKGLRRLTREHCDFLAKLPIDREAVESLNVAAAAAVALYELAAQRKAALSSVAHRPD
ncbi:MAG: 23S rRNA (guanosine(2251)-2'-O)-methyltransferase RlmB [Alphaproteobacteria bacterium]